MPRVLPFCDGHAIKQRFIAALNRSGAPRATRAAVRPPNLNPYRPAFMRLPAGAIVSAICNTG
jgi:hypothetical protein